MYTAIGMIIILLNTHPYKFYSYGLNQETKTSLLGSTAYPLLPNLDTFPERRALGLTVDPGNTLFFDFETWVFN